MKHLGVLVEAGLVTVERRGRERFNHGNPIPLERAFRRWVWPDQGEAGVATSIPGLGR